MYQYQPREVKKGLLLFPKSDQTKTCAVTFLKEFWAYWTRVFCLTGWSRKWKMSALAAYSALGDDWRLSVLVSNVRIGLLPSAPD